MTQSDVARAIGVAGGERVSRWELGLSEPQADSLVRLAAVLQVNPQEILVSMAEPDLRRLRVLSGRSLRDLAQDVGSSAPAIARWENGRVQALPAGAASRLADALGQDEADILAAFAVSRRQRDQSY